MQSMETKLLKAAAKWNAKNPDGSVLALVAAAMCSSRVE
jgi:hypothetical protein